MTDSRRASLQQLMDAELHANQHPYRKANGWQVNQAVVTRPFLRSPGRTQVVRAWHFYAAHWDLNEPLVVAPTLAKLQWRVLKRQQQIYERLPLAFRNRRLIAERMNWPPGVLQECEQLEERYPAWAVSWNKGSGYTGRLNVAVHGCDRAAEDPDDLDVLMDEVPLEHDYTTGGCAWCWSQLAEREARRAG